MAEQVSPHSSADHGSSSSPEEARRDEEISLLRKVALSKKPWWQEPAILIAGMAFLLSLVTAITSAWTTYWNDIHEQQARLEKLILDMKDLQLQYDDVSVKYKDNADLLANLQTLLNTQRRGVQRYAVDIAMSLGTRASASELVVLGQDSSAAGLRSEALSLFQLAVSASTTPMDKQL